MGPLARTRLRATPSRKTACGTILANNMGMNTTHPYSLSPIGIIHSAFTEAKGTPVQPFAARDHLGGGDLPGDFPHAPYTNPCGGVGTLEINPEWEEALLDLEGFSRVWILFWCHRSAPAQKVAIPYRDTVPHGLFATRAPARPNPIGLSCVRLTGIRGRFVHVAEMDALHGSPLLDIKPYVPLYDSFGNVRCGWLEGHENKNLAVHADARFEKSDISVL